MFQVKKGATMEVLKDQKLLNPANQNLCAKGSIVQIDDPAVAQSYIDSGLCRVISWITGPAEVENRMEKVVKKTKEEEIIEEKPAKIIPKPKECKPCKRKKAVK